MPRSFAALVVGACALVPSAFAQERTVELLDLRPILDATLPARPGFHMVAPGNILLECLETDHPDRGPLVGTWRPDRTDLRSFARDVLGALPDTSGARIDLAGEDLVAPAKEVDWVCRLAADIGRPVTWLMLQNNFAPHDWKELMVRSAEAQAAGHRVVPQVAGRPFGVLLGLQTGRHRFAECPSFAPLRDRTPADVARAMADPELKARLLDESRALVAKLAETNPLAAHVSDAFDRTYVLGDPVDYEPTDADSVAGRAAARTADPLDEYYECLRERDGMAMLMMPA